MAKTSSIVIKDAQSGKTVLKKKKAEAAVEKIIAKMKQIQQEYEWTGKYYNWMLTKGNEDGGAISSDDDFYQEIKDARDRANKRASYCTNRINNLNSLFHQDVGDEASFLANKVADLEKELAKLKKQDEQDKDES